MSARGGRTRRRTTRRYRAAVAGTAIVGGVIVAQQIRNPASFTRAAATRRRIVNTHVGRARTDHEHLASVRASVFPTTAVTGRRFDEGAARREAMRLTTGYRRQAKRMRRAR